MQRTIPPLTPKGIVLNLSDSVPDPDHLQREPKRFLRNLPALVSMNILMRISTLRIDLRILPLKVEPDSSGR